MLFGLVFVHILFSFLEFIKYSVHNIICMYFRQNIGTSAFSVSLGLNKGRSRKRGETPACTDHQQEYNQNQPLVLSKAKKPLVLFDISRPCYASRYYPASGYTRESKGDSSSDEDFPYIVTTCEANEIPVLGSCDPDQSRLGVTDSDGDLTSLQASAEPVVESRDAETHHPQDNDLDNELLLDLQDVNIRCSTPCCSSPLPDFSFQSESSDSSDSEQPSADSDNSSFDSINLEPEYLFPGSTVTTENFQTGFLLLSTMYCFSDVCSESVLDFINLILPRGAEQAIRAIRRKLRTKSADKAQYDVKAKNENESFVVLPVYKQLSEIVSRNLQIIREYSERPRCDGIIDDIIITPPKDEHYQVGTNSLILSLIINADGVPVVKSTNLSIWPVWAAIAELPPKLRMSYKNIVLIGVWCGRKPDWEFIWNSCIPALSILESGLRDISGLTSVFFRIYLLVADMPAKCALLNMKQFNGYFG